MKDLILIRGVSGAGKTTLANLICNNFVSRITHNEADFFFEDGMGGYDWDANKLGAAHVECYNDTERDMQNGYPTIIVSNTFTREKELQPYIDLAVKYGYKVTSLIVETRHNGGDNGHNVPLETINKMRNRFSIKL